MSDFSKTPEDCICDLKGVENPPRWTHTNQSFRCPFHGLAKMYCRLHRNGFYGSCNLCLLDDAVKKSLSMAPDQELTDTDPREAEDGLEPVQRALSD